MEGRPGLRPWLSSISFCLKFLKFFSKMLKKLPISMQTHNAEIAQIIKLYFKNLSFPWSFKNFFLQCSISKQFSTADSFCLSSAKKIHFPSAKFVSKKALYFSKCGFLFYKLIERQFWGNFMPKKLIHCFITIWTLIWYF